MADFEELWDEESLKNEFKGLFKELDEDRWNLDAGLAVLFNEHVEAGKPPVEFYRKELGFVYQSFWNQATNDERSKYIAIHNYADSHDLRSAIDFGAGVGAGVITLAFLSMMEKVVAVEVSLPCIKVIKGRIERFGLENVKVVDIYPDKWTRHKADLAICTEVFEHVDDPKEMAHKIFKLINPGGAMIASWSFVPMTAHLPEHFDLQARHPDTLLTEGFGKFLVEEVGFIYDGPTWFNNTAWRKPVVLPDDVTITAAPVVVESEATSVEVISDEGESGVEPTVVSDTDYDAPVEGSAITSVEEDTGGDG